MRIQNRSLADCQMNLRYSRNAADPTQPCLVEGDAEGIFDVPQKDAEFLLATKGWRRAPKKKPVVEVAPIIKEDPNEPGPDVDGLKSKAKAIECAEEWREKGYAIEPFSEDMKLSEMKKLLNAALYAEGE